MRELVTWVAYQKEVASRTALADAAEGRPLGEEARDRPLRERRGDGGYGA